MVASIEIWDEGFNVFEVSQDTDTVSTHTGTSVDIATAPWTINEWIGYSIKFTDGALDDNGYVITGNDTNTITCSDADFSTLSNGEAFKIISTGKVLDNTSAPVAEISLSTETVQTLTQSYDYGFDDLFILSNTNSPVAEISLSTETIQTLTQSYDYGFDDLFIFGGSPPITGTHVISGNVYNQQSNPVASATVRAAGGSYYPTTSNSAGAYSLTVYQGIYDVTASKTDYHSDSQTVDASSSDQTQDFTLTQTPVTLSGGGGNSVILKMSHHYIKTKTGRHW